MKRNKWTLGMVLAGTLVLSGGALALASGTNFSLGQSLKAKTQTVASENKGANPGVQVSGSGQKSETAQPGQTLPDSAAQTGAPGASAPSSNEQGGQQQSNTQNPAAKENTSSTAKAVISSTPNSSPNSSIGGQYGFGGYGMMGGFTGPNDLGYGTGYGMMGGAYGAGYGMMGGFGGPNGAGLARGYGMMGGGYNAQNLGVDLSNGQVAAAEQAEALANAYLQKTSPDLAVDELHEFADSFEVEAKDASTGAKAYEFVISKNGGYVYAEMGPNVMWNTKYGHMNWGNSGSLTVSADQARQTAQSFVQKLGQEYSLEGPETAPGYYEFMVMKDGKDYAELNVNGYSGQVWFETWHGPIVSTVKVK
ncbi:PepSY domain-containing protein [Paradesulfitobacterium ferrireducens]|uniref:PepSY domain-containing protein n=1 Tax=Paradesulfitobacterium ferrireducens TaxID=2816476 RepID=UPI001A8FF4F7|nr:PepSY domain-containing protein [Paradesulfitobacterium ferrireducens]